jgi:hypothetical protein
LSGAGPPMRLERQPWMLSCRMCGWVHYAMTAAEKAQKDRALQRYDLTAAEWSAYESSWRQCLRCEAPASELRDAEESDLARAIGHIVTPVLVEEARESRNARYDRDRGHSSPVPLSGRG